MAFDWTVNLGNVLTIVSIAALAIAGWRTFEKRIDTDHLRINIIERWIDGHKECSRDHDKVVAELRETVAYLKGKFQADKGA